MKKQILVTLFLMLGSLAFGQVNLPPCDPNNLPPNCTDYFGVANWANSPLPAGAIAGFTIVSAGSGYVNPIVLITDTSGTGATAPALTLDASGGIATATGGGGGTGYIAPQVTIVDVGLNGTLAAPTCGALGQPACGSGALVAATIGGPLVPATGIRKFVDTLTLPLANLPIGVPDTTTFPGSDYYVIALQQYSTKMHADLPSTTLRGYVQLNNGTPTASNPTGAPPPISYLGPTILAQKNRPVRVLFKNMLPTGAGGNLFIPVDTTYMGAGPPYAQNRATLHLHGGATPWISDGTPHQWTAPAGEAGPARGESVQFVPDMWFDASGNLIASCAGQATCSVIGATNDPGPDNLTFFWTNQQGGRLMFYHDHAYGLTRLNVYAGEAAGYLLVDPVEEAALAAATVPGTITTSGADLAHLVPLVIQDKTFVPSAAQLATEDPTWTAGGFGTTPGLTNPGDLWFPHVYTPNQDPADVGGANAFGRWDYGPWTLPGNQTVLLAGTPTVGDVTIPCTSSAFPNQAVNCPITPNPSGTPESFMDTPLVNGKAYPVLHVAPEAYRFQILSAGNDRSWNLQWYVADPTVTTPDGRTNTEVKMVPAIQPAAGALVPLCSKLTPITNTSLFMGLATAVLDATGNPVNGTGLPAGCWPNFGAGSQAAGIPVQQTMWAADGRAGGAPDPTTAGPPFIQIGTEGGLLPAPVVIPSMPTGYEANTRSVTITNVSVHGLWLGPAERADAIVDFSKFAGKTLILYNDAPTPAPAVDSRLDYFTGDGDQTIIGGAPNTIPGFGPNTRTIMQVVVDQPPTGKPFSLPALTSALPTIFQQTQPAPIVPEPTYPPASGGYSAIPTYSLITDASLTFYPVGSTTAVTYTDERKTIQELFTLDYGRMNATLGVELPLTNFLTQTTIPLGYIDPITEIMKSGETQFWHITHNGVDTHFIHFHLFNVQVINRSAWDGTKRPPDQNELGWKDTVRMNPLEDILVALTPIQPTLPFPLRDSYRPMDVTMPAGSNCPDPATLTTGSPTPAPCSIFTNIDPVTNNPTPTPNGVQNYGWEYVWHCHILGHEENDMMRAIAFNVPPEAPSNLTIAAATSGLNLSWIDNSASETGFTLQRADDAGFTKGVINTTVSPITGSTDANGQGITWGGTQTYNDTSATGGPYFYSVQATKPEANYWASGVLTSTWSNTASFAANSGAPFASVSPATLAFGNVALLATSAPQTLTLSNTGNAPFTYTASKLGPNLADFTVLNTCGGSVLANSRCTLSVTFTPTSGGTESAILLISTNDPLNPTLTVSLTGTTGLPLLTITANNETMRYGSTVPPITFTYTPPNPVGLTPPTCTTLATKTSPVGTYPIACTGATGNYTFTYVPGTVSVTPAPLTIWASSATMPVGGFPPVAPSTTYTLPVITPSYVGFVAGDTADNLGVAPNLPPTCSTTVTLATPVGKYANSTSCTGAKDPNYTISYAKGSVTVAVGVLTITAPTNLTMTYGGTVPTLTPTYSPASPVGLTTPAVCTTSASSTSPVGTYPITCSGAVDPNFTIGYVAGILTVAPAPLVITAPSPTMLYGGPLPTTLSPTYASFVAGDTAASLKPQPLCTTTATTASPVGTYPVTCSGAVDANYTISYVAGTLTVNPAVVTVTASSANMTYGGLPPAITPSYSGFVLNQTSGILTTVPTCSTTATSTSPVSPPTIPSTCSGAAALNYTFNYVPGAVTVIGAPLTITANTASKVYGTALTLPGTAFTVTGLLNTDTVTSVTLTSPGTLATAPVGSYPISPSAAVGTGLANYTITYSTTGTLTVTPAGLTITAKPASKVYGQLLTFVGTEFTATGLLNTDTVTTATLTSAGTPATAVVGTYPIVPSAAIGTGLGNYTIAYANGVLTVTPATTSTAITSNLPNPAILGQIVTVRFGVAPQFTQTPTGTVTVKASTGETCSGALAAGVGSCPLTFFIGGPRTLTATYSGDPNFLGSASPTANQLVSGISLSTTSLLFGDQVVGTASAVQTVTLSNVGTTTITFTSITWSANFSATNNCGTSLAPGRSCRINVRFVPTTTGVLTGTLTIVDSDPTNPQVVTLTGTGVTPSLQVSPGALTFSSPMNVRTASQPVTVSNTGTAPLTINNNSIYLGGANAGQFAQLNNCVGTLAPGANCTVNVTFLPTFGAAPKNAVLNVTAAAPATPQTVTLTGTVIVPTFTLTPNPLSFGNQLVGTTSASQPITMTNTSTAAVTINSISLGGNVQFAQTNNCGASLAGGASCTINVTFKPTSRGIKNATLTVFVAAPATAQSVTLTGTGQ